MWQCQRAQHQERCTAHLAHAANVGTVLSLMGTEIGSLLGAQARLALPRVLGGNQALIDLCLTSAFKILFL